MMLAVVAFVVGDSIERAHPDPKRIARLFGEFVVISILVVAFLLLFMPAV
jgi:hypothetical protein